MAKFFLLTLGLAAAQLNPITRVAELLENLMTKVEADAEKEQDLYDGFKCWCMKVINGKSASIESNEQRVAELAAYIDDLDSGRIELTSERSDLETEVKGLEKAIADETAMRTKENTDFLAAKAELEKAIAALEGAVSTMEAGTNSSNRSTMFTSFKSKLEKAVRVGEGAGFLAKRDVKELFKALQAQDPDVPDVDFEKLNREATFKMQYEHRSGEIQDILAEMLTTFKDNLNESTVAEAKAKSDSETLIDSKQTQLDTAKAALMDQSGEMGARGASKADSEQEKSDLEGENERDRVFISDTKATCAAKASDFQERTRVRTAEKAAIQQTIATLRSDDARDLFKKSFGSQGKTFIQDTSFIQQKEVRRSGALSTHSMQRGLMILRKAAIKAGDLRLLALVHKNPTESDPFSEIKAEVDTFIADLEAEEAADLAEKEKCEKDRHEKNAAVEMESKAIDSNTARIERWNGYIAEAEKVVETLKEEIKALEDQKADAEAQRTKEHTEFGAALEDDTAAIEVVTNAIKVLTDFYAKENLALGFLQVEKKDEQPAGEAPTPPPATWDEGGYEGAGGESGGVVGLMEMIKADIGKDIQKADQEEADAVTAYDKLVADIDADILSLETHKSNKELEISDDEGSVTSEKTERGSNQEEMKAHLDYLASIAKSCDYMAAEFENRKEARTEEMDNLHKAKAVFDGAEFAEAPAEEF
jgi:hypothetical protein